MQKSAAFLMVSVLLLGLFLMSQSRQYPAVAQVDNTYADWIETNSAGTAKQPHVALVEINNSSLDSDHPWPWSPLEYALFMRAVLQFKPDVVAIEPALDWENPEGASAASKQQQSMKILHDYVLQAPKIVLGSRLGAPDDPDVVPPLQPVPLLRNVKGDVTAIPDFTAIAEQAGEDLRLSTTVGFTNVPYQGEVTRKAPLVFRYRGQVVPSLTLQAMIAWLKITPDDVVVEPGVRIKLGKKTEVPIDAAGRMNVDFTAPLTRVGYDDLLLALDQQKGEQMSAAATSAIKGSIVLLARTDGDSRTLLFPTEARSSTGELCAQAIATIQDKAFVRRVSHKFDLALIALMMVFSFFCHKMRKRAVLLVSFAGLLGYLILSMSVYEIALVWLPIVLPVGLLALVNFFRLFSPREGTAAPGADKVG